MIKTRKSGAKYSAIVGMGETFRKLSQEQGKEFLYLDRGINMVENIDCAGGHGAAGSGRLFCPYGNYPPADIVGHFAGDECPRPG